MVEAVDWEMAHRVGARLSPAGPDATAEQAAAVVAQLRELAVEAEGHVEAVSGLRFDVSAGRLPSVVQVVDRKEWIRANVAQFEYAVRPLAERMGESESSAADVAAMVGSRVTAVELGAVLSYLSAKVLGQYEAFTGLGAAPPRLLLVAPNIVAAERELDVPERDFRLWVCLHEETHRLQFGANPWLAQHFTAEVHALVAGSEASFADLVRRAGRAAGAVVAGVRGVDGAPSIVEAMQSPDQRERMDDLVAMMTLLEGHADYVMDEVGPGVLPSVELIRERFDKRRHQPRGMEAITRRVLGLEAKMQQYAEGAAFVREVVDAVGIEQFNRIWSGPDTLPKRDEIADPSLWVARVL